MKKSLGLILSSVVIVLLVSAFVYFYISLVRLEKKIETVRTAVVDDSGKITAIVNFLNTSLNAQSQNNK
jgi:ABC-type Na+ efflux pump permease subunit